MIGEKLITTITIYNLCCVCTSSPSTCQRHPPSSLDVPLPAFQTSAQLCQFVLSAALLQTDVLPNVKPLLLLQLLLWLPSWRCPPSHRPSCFSLTRWVTWSSGFWGSSRLPSKDHLGDVVHLLLPHRLLPSPSAPASPDIFWNVLLLIVFLYFSFFWNLMLLLEFLKSSECVLVVDGVSVFFFLLEWVVTGGVSEILWNVLLIVFLYFPSFWNQLLLIKFLKSCGMYWISTSRGYSLPSDDAGDTVVVREVVGASGHWHFCLVGRWAMVSLVNDTWKRQYYGKCNNWQFSKWIPPPICVGKLTSWRNPSCWR